jgi:hypothetical protein
VTGLAQPKHSWPLLLLAGLSFIPFLGIFFAAGAVSWGLVSNRRRARLAIILGAIGGLLTVGEGVAVAMWASRSSEWGKAQQQLIQDDLRRVAAAIDAYRNRTGRLPPDLATLARPGSGDPFLNIIDRSASLFSMSPFKYTRLEGGAYDLYAVGKDGLPNTTDDIRAPRAP